jgi:hypothetical protein
MPRDDVYRFGYQWRIRGPIERVSHYVSDARTFPEWFGVFKEVKTDDPVCPVRVGSHTVARVQALLPAGGGAQHLRGLARDPRGGGWLGEKGRVPQ